MVVTRTKVLLAGLLLLAAACAGADPKVGHISPAELEKRIQAGNAPIVLDVRTPAEYAAGHIPGAINIPHDQLASRLGELGPKRDEEIVVHCQSGRRASMAEHVLRDAGFQHILDLDGHWKAWKESGYPEQK